MQIIIQETAGFLRGEWPPMKSLSKVLVVAGLSNPMLDCFLKPIAGNSGLPVDVLRTSPGIQRENVSFICPPRAFQGSRMLTLLWKIWRSLLLGLKGDFTCVHAILVFPHLYLASLISLLSRKPLVYTVIASAFEFTGKGTLGRMVTPRLARRASMILAPNVKTYEYLNQEGYESNRTVLYPLVDLVNLQPFFPMESERHIDLVVVSRLTIDKNIDLFVDIVDLVKGANPSVSAAIIGDGFLKVELEEYVSKKGLTPNIRFYGYVVSVQELNKILNSSKMFILNSSHEGGPFSIIEAMAAGLCCVSSKVGHVPDVIKHNQNGFIVEKYNDLSKYAEIILELLRDSERLSMIQEEASLVKVNQRPDRPIRLWKQLIERFS
jgi:glycosyltransferase involved in cell wall biosynthesis